MANLSCLLTLIFFITIIRNSSSARNLGNPSSNHHHKHHKISFSMPDLLHISQPATPKLTSHLPFSKPVGFFPPNKGIPIPESVPRVPGSSSSTQSLDVPNLGLYFPARATLQELEFGAAVTIDETLFNGGSVNGSPVGKAQGVYVATSESDASHMMAMATVFADGGFKDELRFFGLHRRDVAESHISVIGGTGKYAGANGYATVEVVKQGVNKFLLFNVYLS